MTALPQQTQQALQRLQPLSELLWQTDKQGVPCCLIKVPQGVRFSDLSVIFEIPSQPYRAGITFPFSTQNAPGQPRVSRTCVFYPSSPDDWQVLTRLSQAPHIQLMGFSSDLTLQY